MIYNLITPRRELKRIRKASKNGDSISLYEMNILKQDEKKYLEAVLQKYCKNIFNSVLFSKQRRGEFVMIGNENNKTKISSGLVAGFPDVMLLIEGHTFFIEFKNITSGKFSDNQNKQHISLDKMGFDVYLIDDYQQFIKILEEILFKI